MRHVSVFQQDGVYAGWPANHGAWQWDDELLFGFLRGKHNIGGMHNVSGPLQKVLARSLDGGATWSIEAPNVDFEAKSGHIRPTPKFDIAASIIRVCGGYDHGGESCAKDGGLYLSHNRGRTWSGPFSFDGIEFSDKQHNTSRTCVLDGLVFLSAAARDHWGSDFVFCATHDGEKFKGKAIVLDDDARAVMPAAVKVRDRIVVATRRRGSRRPGGWIDSVFSDDGGASWSAPLHVAETGKDNGNPPAMVELGGKIYCAYANRSERSIEVMASDDGAYSWKAHALLRKGSAPDIGYPRLFKRVDGQLVCVYYWTEESEKAQRIEATVFDG